MTGESLLVLMLAIPIVGALVVLVTGRSSVGLIKVTGLAASIAAFAISLFVAVGFDPQLPGFQMVTQVPWVESLGISFHVGTTACRCC